MEYLEGKVEKYQGQVSKIGEIQREASELRQAYSTLKEQSHILDSMISNPSIYNEISQKVSSHERSHHSKVHDSSSIILEKNKQIGDLFMQI